MHNSYLFRHVCYHSRAILTPFSEHHFKSFGFVVAVAAFIFSTCLCIPTYVMITFNRLFERCAVTYLPTDSLTGELYKKPSKGYSNLWNNLLLIVPSNFFGLILPLGCSCFFYHKARKGLLENHRFPENSTTRECRRECDAFVESQKRK